MSFSIFGTALLTVVPAVQFSGLLDPVSSLRGIGAFIGTIFPTTYFVTISRGSFSKALDFAARAELIKQNPAYGQIICRCESVTEGEIIDAIHRTPGARSLDGVKRRTRAGMGRCQAGFCSPRVMEILARELGVAQSEITKSGGDSKIIVGTNKDAF